GRRARGGAREERGDGDVQVGVTQLQRVEVRAVDPVQTPAARADGAEGGPEQPDAPQRDVARRSVEVDVSERGVVDGEPGRRQGAEIERVDRDPADRLRGTRRGEVEREGRVEALEVDAAAARSDLDPRAGAGEVDALEVAASAAAAPE